jgi:hypothetical protein
MISTPGAYSNCEDGGLLTFGVTCDVLAAANGVLRTVACVEGGAAGDFLRLQPFSGRARLHALTFAGDTAIDVEQVGVGQFVKDGKQVNPTFSGSLVGAIVSGATFNAILADGLGASINAVNPQCLPWFDNDSPLELALSNSTGVDIVELHISITLEYVPK